MSGILAAFALGAIGWWCLTILFVLYGFIASDRDYDEKGNLFWPITVLIIYILFVQFVARVDILNLITHKPIVAILYTLGYFAVGFAWSFIKWWLFVSTIAEKYKAARAEFMAEYQPRESAIPDNIRRPDGSFVTDRKQKEWEDKVRYEHLSKPMVSKHKNKITVWVMYWPLSAIWSLLDDFIKKMIRQIITSFQRFYQFISDRAFRKFESDITQK